MPTRPRSGLPSIPSVRSISLGSNSVKALGDDRLLANQKLGLFCSRKCPGELILKGYDLMQNLRDSGVTVISGFHAPIDKEALRILLRGKQPVIICPARSIDRMRIPRDWRQPIDQGRLLVLSPFPAKARRMTRELAEKRNRFVAELADALLFIHAASGSKTEVLCRELVTGRKPVYTLESDHNHNLTALGIRLAAADNQDWFG